MSSNLRDRELTQDVYEFVANHRQLESCEISVEVRGGVAHVTGTVTDAAQRELLRNLVSRIKGINAVWDTLGVPGQGAPLVIDIGCGYTKQYGWALGVDRFQTSAVDVIADLEKGLPFADESIDQVFAVHFLEHIHNLLELMNEIHRVLKPTGVLHLMVPNSQFVNALADPTHVRFFHLQTFKFFCRPYHGLLEFKPLSAAVSADNIFADLQPVKTGEQAATDNLLSRFFD